MVKSIVIIPSRLGSTRLPKKPLIKLMGKSLIRRVYEGSSSSKLADKVIVATDSELIVEEIEKIGGECVMTPSELKTGTDRVAYVAGMDEYKDYDIVINVQGDEPFVNGEMIDAMIDALIDEDEAVVSTLVTKFTTKNDINNPNYPKVILTKDNYAIYFSRSKIPYEREILEGQHFWKHMGYYGYKRDFLLVYPTLEQTPLEKAESLEQLRVLENGYKIKVVETDFNTVEINIPEDIMLFEEKYDKEKKSKNE